MTLPRVMRAFALEQPAPDERGPRPLVRVEREVPTPKDDELLVRVEVCGVCRTDLDLAEGRLTAPRYHVIPGHQVVGRVVAMGKSVTDFREGDATGIAWIHWACGVCEYCTSGRENLCPRFRATGCDIDGGYADFVRVPAKFAHRLPDGIDAVHAAPLLCAGAIGWRSLRLTELRDGEPLGLTGFGASAHLVLQLAARRFPKSSIFVFARSEDDREFARSLGAAWAGDTTDAPPEPLSAIIDTTPAWKPVVAALAALRPGGRLVINAIRKERTDQSELLALDYAKHLWMERQVRSVANVTRADVRECLAAAAEWGIEPTVRELRFEQANEALASFRASGTARGAMVLRVAE